MGRARHYFRDALQGFLLLLGAHTAAFAQNLADTLPAFELKNRIATTSPDERLNAYTPGQRKVHLDSLTLQHYRQLSLAQLLADRVPVFVKSYGFNALATLQFRGSSAAQSGVYWMGIPLQQSALGVADVSLLASGLFASADVVYGGSAALWGSGNVGGAVLLDGPTPAFSAQPRWQVDATTSIGSFGQRTGQMHGRWQQKHWDISLRGIGQQATNDFSYKNLLGQEANTRHAQLQGLSGLLHISRKVSAKDLVTGAVWQQRYDRDIPAALFEDVSTKNRIDQSTRTVLHWQHDGKARWHLRTGWFRDDLTYRDDTIRLHAAQTVHQFYGEAGLKLTPGNRQELLLFAPMQLAGMQSDSGWRQQRRLALAAAYQWKSANQALQLALQGRTEWIDDVLVGLPGANMSLRLRSWLMLKGNVQRTYRAPTLNEWYAIPGGNPSLKPESGWAADGGYVLQFMLPGNIRFRQELSLYSRWIDNWILWFGGAIWTPHNIARVRSRGLEWEQRLDIPIHQSRIQLSGSWQYTQARTMRSRLPGDGSVGRQIPYTPLFSSQCHVSFIRPFWFATLNYTYTGYRYFNTDETGLLPAYQLLNLYAQGTLIRGKRGEWNVHAQVQNLLNERYIVVNGRPMPGRYFLAGIGFRFQSAARP